MQNEKEVIITARDAAPFMRPLLAKLDIVIDDDGRVPGEIQYSGLFDMPPRPFLKRTQFEDRLT